MYLPTQSRSEPNRHVRHAAHWVRESMSSRVAKCLCSCLLTLLLVVGIIFFVLWLSLRPHRPRFYLVGFAAPGIANPAGLANSSITFNVTDRNPNQKIGIYYGAMFGSVYYQNRLIGTGPVLVPSYQPTKNTTAIAGQLSGVAIPTGDTAFLQLSSEGATGRVGLRLTLNSNIRFKVKIWDTHQHHLHVECSLYVGSDGELLPESRGIRCPIYF